MKRRDWSAARAKVDQEARCRVCKRTGRLEAAHVIGRKYDPPSGKVQADDVLPLCPDCHRSYDARELDLLPYLTLAEQAAAVAKVGIVRAIRRTGGCEYD